MFKGKKGRMLWGDRATFLKIKKRKKRKVKTTGTELDLTRKNRRVSPGKVTKKKKKGKKRRGEMRKLKKGTQSKEKKASGNQKGKG